MNAKKVSYTEDFRTDAVALLHSSGRALKAVAADLGITANTLRSWRNRRIGTDSAPTQTETAEQELKRLRRENAYLRRQRDILKKAASILAEDPQAGMR